VETHCVSHVLPEWRDEKQARAHSYLHHKPVEVEGPALGLDLWWRQLRVLPLSDEVRQDLGLDRFAQRVRECLADQLHRHLAILPATSGFQMISPNGKEETTVTG
jgi:hypothetical protein